MLKVVSELLTNLMISGTEKQISKDDREDFKQKEHSQCL